MNKPTRRKFMEESMIAAGVLAATQARGPAAMAEETSPGLANERVRHAVIGCRIRGRVHAKEFGRQPGVEVAYVCDPDSKLRHELATDVEEQTGKRPIAVADMRAVFDDDTVDTVSIAAPNHWHALAAIWAMQSGKDVYVEKPVSHNVVEGRRIVQTARKYSRICQGGTQNRSRGDLAAAAEFIRAGKLGEVTLARTIVYGNRKSIGPKGRAQIPNNIDFNLWLGPASNAEISRPQLHYDWHWVWDTGNGELGNNNIHYVDIVRWLAGLEGLGDSVVSVGGRVGYRDAGETPNTQMVVHQFGGSSVSHAGKTAKPDVTVIQEVRGLKSDPFSTHFKAGHVIHGTEGFIAEGSLFDPKGRMVKTFEGPSVNHFQNFIAAVRSRKGTDLRAEIAEGHQSTALCHVGNISHRLGEPLHPQGIEERLKDLKLNAEATQAFRKLLGHLGENQIDPNETRLTLGPQLHIDNQQERFVDRDDANRLLARDYRRPFVVPSETEI